MVMRQPLVQERHLPEPGGQGVVGVHRGLEDVRARVEGDRGAGRLGRLVPLQRRHRVTEQEVLGPAVAVPAYVDVEGGRQRVDHRHPDPVQAAGDLVAPVAELAAGVQHGQRQGDRRDLLGRVLLDRDAAAVVDDLDPALGQDAHDDGVAVAGQRLVDSVVNHLVHQVVQSALTGGADVHARALADRLQPLEHGDGLGVVVPRLNCRGTDLVQVVRGGGQLLRGDVDVLVVVGTVGLVGRGGHLCWAPVTRAPPGPHPERVRQAARRVWLDWLMYCDGRTMSSLPGRTVRSVRSLPTMSPKVRLRDAGWRIWRTAGRSG